MPFQVMCLRSSRMLRRQSAWVAKDKVLLGWQSQVLGPWQDQIVIVDGKKVCHAGVEIVNAADSQGRFLGSTVTARKSNGIPAFQSRFKSAHGGRERLHALIHAKLPNVLDL